MPDQNSSTTGAGRFRKKSVEVEAVQWTGENLGEIRSFIGLQTISRGKLTGALFYGHQFAAEGDWLVREPDGAVEAYSPEKFEATYEPAQQDQPALSLGQEDRERLESIGLWLEGRTDNAGAVEDGSYLRRLAAKNLDGGAGEGTLRKALEAEVKWLREIGEQSEEDALGSGPAAQKTLGAIAASADRFRDRLQAILDANPATQPDPSYLSEEGAEIERWTVSRDLPAGIEPDSLGGLVKFADHLAREDELRRRAEKAEGELAQLEESIDQAQDFAEEHPDKIARLSPQPDPPGEDQPPKALTLEEKKQAEAEGAASGQCPFCEGGMDALGGIHAKDCPMLAPPVEEASTRPNQGPEQPKGEGRTVEDCDDLCTCGHERYAHMVNETEPGPCAERGCGCTCKGFELPAGDQTEGSK